MNDNYTKLLNSSQEKLNTSKNKIILSSILAGIFISFGCIFNLYLQYLFPNSTGKLLGSLFFSIGLILVFLAQGKLFTGDILMFGGLYNKKLFKLSKLIKYWLLVYLGNFIGCFLTSITIFYSKTFNNQIYEQINKLIQVKSSKTFLVLLLLGVLCNILVCLAVWINYSSKNIIEKILIPILPVSLFVLCGFEHSVADMFYISISDLLSYNLVSFIILIPVTIGNIIGGIVITTLYYFINKNNPNN